LFFNFALFCGVLGGFLGSIMGFLGGGVRVEGWLGWKVHSLTSLRPEKQKKKKGESMGRIAVRSAQHWGGMEERKSGPLTPGADGWCRAHLRSIFMGGRKAPNKVSTCGAAGRTRDQGGRGFSTEGQARRREMGEGREILRGREGDLESARTTSYTMRSNTHGGALVED